MKRFNYWLAVLTASLLFYACEETDMDKQEHQPAQGELVLSLSEVGSVNGRMMKTILAVNPTSAFISVKDTMGNYVLNMEELPLIKVGNGYVTKNIIFPEGSYTIEDFIVLDSAGAAIYLTPKKDSEFESLVNSPLPISFDVFANNVTDVTLEVIPANLGEPAMYGYATFSFNIVNTIEKGLIGYYLFDGNVADTSQYANHAINSTDGIYTKGVSGQALYFDGVDDYLTLENSLSLSKEFAFSFWVNSKGANGIQNNGAIVSKYNYRGRSFEISTYGYQTTRGENMIHAHFFGENGQDLRKQDWIASNLSYNYLKEKNWDTSLWNIIDSDTLTTYKWTHVVVNMDSSTLSVYIDGKLKVSKQREYDVYFDSSEKTYIGNMFNGADGNNNHFHGYLDELRIYDRSLYAQEIEALYHQ